MTNLKTNSELKEDLAIIETYKHSGKQQDLLPFYNKYVGLIYGVCLKYLKEPEKSKDAVMDIYEKLVEKLKTHTVAFPKSWLYTLTKNHCYEQLRKKARAIEKENDAHLMYSNQIFHPIDISEKENKLNLLEECIKSLGKEQKETVRLFYLDKKTYKEITDILEISWNKARSLIQNGRRNLKKCMESYEPKS